MTSSGISRFALAGVLSLTAARGKRYDRLVTGFGDTWFVSGLVLVLVAAGAGVAIGSDASEREDPASSNPRAVTGPESLGFVPEREWRAANGLPPLSESDEVDFAAEGPSPQLAEVCRTGGAQAAGSTALHCDAIIAVAEGRLPPGTYSDEQLRAKLGDG